MMKINVITMYPEIFDGFCKNPIVDRAVKSGAVSVNFVDIKEHTDGCYRKLDDSPYGGSPGMIIRVDALDNALSSVKAENPHTVLLSPKGAVFNRKKARELASYSELTIICGHYEGLDARIENFVDEQISIGDFVLSGGENAACVICDSIIRLLPGVLKDGVTEDESFENGLLECKQYTHPAEYKGMAVPPVLLSGNKAEIERFKKASSLMETAKYRPELLYKYGRKESVGYSKDTVLKFDDMVMKIGSSRHEVDMLQWLKGKIEVPEVLDYYQGDKSYLLMSEMSGKMLSNPDFTKDPEVVISIAVKALKQLWDVDIKDCPKDMENKPGMPAFGAPVFSHGNLCLENIIVGKKGRISYINLELAGIEDRFSDMSCCLRSMEKHMPDYKIDYEKFFKMLGIIPVCDESKNPIE